MTTGPHTLTYGEAKAIADELRRLADEGNATAAAYIAVVERSAAYGQALAQALPVIYRQARELAAIAQAVRSVIAPDADDEAATFGDVPPFDALQVLIGSPPQPTIAPESPVSAPPGTQTHAAAWETLAAWLDHPANNPAAPIGNVGTIRQLETLEALAVNAGLWEADHLDRLAHNLLELDPPDIWRAEVLNLDNLRRFAKRALLEAHAHADADPRIKTARLRRRQLGRGPNDVPASGVVVLPYGLGAAEDDEDGTW